MSASAPRLETESQCVGGGGQEKSNDIPELLMEMFTRFRVKDALDSAARWCVENPHLAIFIIVGLLVFALPMFVLLGFVLSTLVITFTGFLFLEGTMLAVVSMLLLACLGAFATVLILFVVTVGVTYFGFSHIYDLYGGFSRNKTALKELKLRERKGAYETSPSI